ncbi:MAG: hypothetical protein JXR37_32235 [Kiritimatiellae bacterium]|nr:hypothetical protein [Kiritimatiellia bacterium]
MPECEIEVLGVYDVPYTKALLQRAMAVKYAGTRLSFWKRRKAKKAVKRELSSIALIEVLVRNVDEPFRVDDFGQPGSDESPHQLTFLTLNGRGAMDASEAPEWEDLRLAFFLHFYDPRRPLKTSHGEVPTPEPRQMSGRLEQFVPYEPRGIVD